jgi:uncharacterized protein involved in exopolysaccharide biosynthesis
MASDSNIVIRDHQQNNENNLPSSDFRESIPNGAEEEIDLRDYIEVILRRRWLVMGVLFFVFVSTLIFSLSAQKLYRATGTIEVNAEQQKVTKFEDVVNETLRSQEFVATQVSLMKSNSISERIISKMSLREHPVFADDGLNKSSISLGTFKAFVQNIIGQDADNLSGNIMLTETMENKKLIDFLQKNLEISPSRNSMIVEVSFISPSRELSQDVVNHLMDEFVGWKMDQRVDSFVTAREYLMKQIERAKIHLESAEEKQHQFARQAGKTSRYV